MRIPDEIIERIKATAPIEEVIGEFVKLKRMGGSLKGLCPFHSEKTPSFNVHPTKGYYHCFGCGVGGNVYNFIMKMNNMDFVESVKYLAQKYGVTIPEYSPEVTREDQERQDIYKVNEKGAFVYHFYLTNKPEGSKAREYLKSRNISEETVKKFNMGYAPGPMKQGDPWDKLYQDLREMKFSDEIIERAGLCKKNQYGRFFDDFRDRLMFPILDLSNHVVAFGGRVLPEILHSKEIVNPMQGSKSPDVKKEEKGEKFTPKYKNSSDSVVFHKSEILYGLNLAKNTIRELDEVVIVEGYFDVIMLVQKGVKNVVAPLGTSLTLGHVNILKRHTRNAVLIFDPDAAGEKATWRTVEMLLDNEFNIRILRLPFGMDPFDYLNTHSLETFQELKNSCPDVFTYMIKYLKAKLDIKTMIGKLKLLSYIFKYLIKLKNEVEKDIVLNTLAKELEVTTESLKVEMTRFQRDATAFVREPKPFPVTNAVTPAEDVWHKLEREFMVLLLLHSERMDDVRSHFNENDIVDDPARRVLHQAIEFYDERGVFSPDDFFNHVNDPELNSMITSIMFSDKFKKGGGKSDPRVFEQEMFKDYMNKLTRRKLDRTIQIIKEHVIDAERLGDLAAIERLQRDLNETVKLRNSYKYNK